MDARMKPRFTLIGTGAIGGTTGAHLIRAGHEVVLVDQDAAHVDAINTNGLTIEGRETFTVQTRAATPAGLVKSATLISGAVLLCVKAMHTSEALSPFVPLLDTDAYVVEVESCASFPEYFAGGSATAGSVEGTIPAERFHEFLDFTRTQGLRVFRCALRKSTLEDAFLRVLKPPRSHA